MWILLGLLAISLVISAIYISKERFFYYWDWAGFQWWANYYATNILHQPGEVFTQIKNSITEEYNHFYTVPLIPVMQVFGKTRLGYVLSLSLVYQFPYLLVIAGIAAKLINYRSRLVFWFSVLIALLTPAILAPTLRGYPDVGAALLIGLAILVYLQDSNLRNWWQIVSIGMLAAAAVLLRRHFAYDAVSFFIALIIQALIRIVPAFRQNHRQAWRDLLVTGLRIGSAGVLVLLTMLIFGKPFLSMAIRINYGNLFSSYELGFKQVASYYLENYGWGTLTLAGLGYFLGMLKQVLNRPAALFILLFGGLISAQWMFIVHQVSVHYTLHFTLIIVLGVAAFWGFIWYKIRNKLRFPLAAGTIVFMVSNLIICLTYLQVNPALDRWLAWRYPPLYRSDYNEVVDLVKFLRHSIPDNSPIYVVDSSQRMNFDLLIKAEQALYPDRLLNVLVTPQIDSRDFYPLELLLKADTVIVSTPTQYHLSNPEEQKLVSVVHDLFDEKWQFTQDFTPLPEQFSLSDHVALSIYRRIRPTSLQTAVLTFAQTRDYLGRRPGGQPDWVVLSPAIYNPIFSDGARGWVTNLDANQLAQGFGYSVLFAEPAAADGTISGTVEYLDTPCAPATLGIQMFGASGKMESGTELALAPNGMLLPFDLEFQNQGVNFLVFSVKSRPEQAESPCPFQLKWTMEK